MRDVKRTAAGRFNRLFNRVYSAVIVLFCRDVVLVHVTEPTDVGPLVRLTVWDTLEDDRTTATVLRAAARRYELDAAEADAPCIVNPQINEN